jgi:hypothetical protein
MYYTYQHNLVQACFWPPKFKFDYVYLSKVVDFYVVENMDKLYEGYNFIFLIHWFPTYCCDIMHKLASIPRFGIIKNNFMWSTFSK